MLFLRPISLLIIVMTLLLPLLHSPVMAANSKDDVKGSASLFLGGGSLLGTLQSINYAGADSSKANEQTGYGFVLDFIFADNHALAVDYYTLSNGYDLPNKPVDSVNSGMFLGYRYHFHNKLTGLYAGGGFLDTAVQLSNRRSIVDNRGGQSTIYPDSEYLYKPTQLLAMTVGYDHVFANNLKGFTLGAHLMSTLPFSTDLQLQEKAPSTVEGGGTLEDFSVWVIGFKIGYSWDSWGGNK